MDKLEPYALPAFVGILILLICAVIYWYRKRMALEGFQTSAAGVLNKLSIPGDFSAAANKPIWKLRIDGDGRSDSWLHFSSLIVNDLNNTNIARVFTGTGLKGPILNTWPNVTTSGFSAGNEPWRSLDGVETLRTSNFYHSSTTGAWFELQWPKPSEAASVAGQSGFNGLNYYVKQIKLYARNEDGLLNRYDGYRIKLYTYDQTTPFLDIPIKALRYWSANPELVRVQTYPDQFGTGNILDPSVTPICAAGSTFSSAFYNSYNTRFSLCRKCESGGSITTDGVVCTYSAPTTAPYIMGGLVNTRDPGFTDRFIRDVKPVRYIRITLINPNDTDFLSLSQVAIYSRNDTRNQTIPAGTNLARRTGVRTYASNFMNKGYTSSWQQNMTNESVKAIDGQLFNKYTWRFTTGSAGEEVWNMRNNGGCGFITGPTYALVSDWRECWSAFHTADTNKPFWAIDLDSVGNGDGFIIDRVVIYNTVNFSNRLSKFKLQFLGRGGVLQQEIPLTSAAVQTYFDCSGTYINSDSQCAYHCQPGQNAFMRGGYIYSCGNPCLAGETRATNDTVTERMAGGAVCIQQCPPSYPLSKADGTNTWMNPYYCRKSDITAELAACQGARVGGDYCFLPVFSPDVQLLLITTSTNGVYLAQGFNINNGTTPTIQILATGVQFKKCFVKKGLFMGITTTNLIMYGGAYNAPTWRRITPPKDTTIEDISFDGDRLLVLTEKKRIGTYNEGRDVYYTSDFHLFRPLWRQINGVSFDTISHFGTRLVGQVRGKAQLASTGISYRMYVMRDFTLAQPGRLPLHTNMNPAYRSGSAFALDDENIAFLAEGSGWETRIIKSRYSIPTSLTGKNPLGLSFFPTMGFANQVAINKGQLAIVGGNNNIYVSQDSLNEYFNNTGYGANNGIGTPIHVDLYTGSVRAPPVTTAEQLFASYDPMAREGIAKCKGGTCRYLRLMPNGDGILHLSQIIVFSTTTTNTNIVKGKRVDYPNFSPASNTNTSTIVDGIYEARQPPFVFISATNTTANNYIQIDLGQDYEISFIILVFPSDTATSARNKGVKVQLYNSSMGLVKDTVTGTTDYEQFVGFCEEGFPQCRKLGTPGMIYGQLRRIYRKDECAAMQGVYDASIGECKGSQPGGSGSFSVDCAGYPTSLLDYPLMNAFDTGGLGRCIFNPVMYYQTYPSIRTAAMFNPDASGNKNYLDVGYIRDEWKNTGFAAGRSPCGNLNLECPFDANTYNQLNRLSLATNASSHYLTTGLQTGLFYCNTRAYIPPRAADKDLNKEFLTKALTSPPPTTCVVTQAGPQGGTKQWLCPDGNAAKVLLDGPQGADRDTKTYFMPGDTVCIKDPNKAGKYYCKTLDSTPAGANYDATIAISNSNMCQMLDNAISDISSNLVSLRSMVTTATWTRTAIETARTQLQSLSTNLQCGTATVANNSRLTSLCTTIQASITNMTTNTVPISTLITNVTTPLNTIIGTRTGLADLRTQFNC